MKKSLPGSSLVQGKLLQGRGDLSGHRINFLVELPQRPLGKQRYHAPARLGLQVTADEHQDALKVETVTEHGNWDTPVVWHNHEQSLLLQSLYTVQPGDLLTAVNETNTGHAMLDEIARKTNPMDTTDMNLRVERELQDILGPYKASPPRKWVQLKEERRPLRGQGSLYHQGKCSSTGDLPSLSRKMYSAGWRAVPSGKGMSSLGWSTFHSSTRHPGKLSPRGGTSLPSIARTSFQASDDWG